MTTCPPAHKACNHQHHQHHCWRKPDHNGNHVCPCNIPWTKETP